MKVLCFGTGERQAQFGERVAIAGAEIVSVSVNTTAEELAESYPDAEYMIADAVTPIGKDIIDALPELKLIHSEGVAFNAIDIDYAAKRGIYVCNNKGANAVAVAEHTTLLMLAITKDLVSSHKAVLSGNQMETKLKMIADGVHELSEYKVGLVGFGDIGKNIASMLSVFGVHVCYYDVFRVSEEVEDTYKVTYMELDELIGNCDIISLHLPVLPSTQGMVNAEFLAKMKRDSYLINTARGELMVNEDVRDALLSGQLAGAAFDTIAPEPVLSDNVLLNMPEQAKDKIICTPHIAGVTVNMFYKAYKTMWENILRVEKEERPINIVNKM